MTAQLVQIGLCHKTATLELRERIGARRDDASARLGSLLRGGEATLLATCGRCELYLYHHDRSWFEPPEIFARMVNEPIEALGSGMRHLSDDEAARHLFRVAAGLESQIIGEPHILGQVGDAAAIAGKNRTAGPVLAALFRAAVHTGKRVRSETSLARPDASFARAAVDYVRCALPARPPPVVLLIGSGNLAGDVAALLSELGPADILMVSRHSDRAVALAARYGARAVNHENLSRHMAEVDVVIACTFCARRPAIDASMLAARARPLTIIDLGVPRNVDPSVSGLPHVNLRALSEISIGPAPAAEAVRAAEHIVERELVRFRRWLQVRRSMSRQAAASSSPRRRELIL